MKMLYDINFSPTGQSAKVAEILVQAFDLEKEYIDLCEEVTEEIQIAQDSICIFSVPCYGGRIPQTAAKRLSMIRGLKTPAIVCVTFGNRAFEDALLELSDLVEKNGFIVVAGGAIATEHNIMHIFGKGRPDSTDKEEIKEFSKKIVKKLGEKEMRKPVLPGKHPYKEWNGGTTTILVNEKTCTHCGLCALKCPVKAISLDGSLVNQDFCIGCMRCIKVCPKKSRSVSQEFVSSLIERLRTACESRKANEFYL